MVGGLFVARFLADKKVVSNVEQCRLLRVMKELMKVISYIPSDFLQKAITHDSSTQESTLR